MVIKKQTKKTNKTNSNPNKQTKINHPTHIGNLPKHLCHGTAGSSHFGTVVTLKQLDIALKEFTSFDTLYMSRSIKVILKKQQQQQSKSVKLEFEFRALLEDTCCRPVASIHFWRERQTGRMYRDTPTYDTEN